MAFIACLLACLLGRLYARSLACLLTRLLACLFACFCATGLSAVTDRPTKSICKHCHVRVLHFIVFSVMLIHILLLRSNTAYLTSMFIASISLSKFSI